MERDRNLLIRASIDHAMNDEAKTRSLHRYVEAKLPKLHHTIELPEGDSAQALVAFLSRYIEHVPDFLDALIDIAKTAGVYSFIDKIIDIAQSYFRNPPELVDDHAGLLALVDEAYLAHRLMEEVNDRILMASGIPLIPMDMTLSNIIVHSLLDDDFANQLDLAVYYSIETLFSRFTEFDNPEFQAYVALHKTEGWEDVLQKWPCLAGDSSIALNFESASEPVSLH